MTRPLRSSFGVGIAVTFALLSFVPAPARAVTPDEIMSDSKLETRARNLSQELRCVVCQNQSIDDSNAPLARDLRVLLRERLVAGDTDQQVLDYLVARYGNFVLLKPPIQLSTLFLWAGPALFLLLAGVSFGRYLRSAAAGPRQAAPLSAAEQTQLEALLDDRRSA